MAYEMLTFYFGAKKIYFSAKRKSAALYVHIGFFLFLSSLFLSLPHCVCVRHLKQGQMKCCVARGLKNNCMKEQE